MFSLSVLKAVVHVRVIDNVIHANLDGLMMVGNNNVSPALDTAKCAKKNMARCNIYAILAKNTSIWIVLILACYVMKIVKVVRGHQRIVLVVPVAMY